MTEADRLAINFMHGADHHAPHKWLAATWRDAEAAASSATVYLGDKKKGHAHYADFCATYVPDVIKIPAVGTPELGEVKNYSPYVRTSTQHPAGTELNGGVYQGGNTEERLKHRVLGTRRRGVPAQGAFRHRGPGAGTGYVPQHDGDYRDAINNRKARVHLLIHETTGAVGSYAARYLRRLARDAVQHGGDGTDYRNTGTGSFLEHYSQRLSAACVMHGAAEGLKAINRAAKNRIARKRRSDVGV